MIATKVRLNVYRSASSTVFHIPARDYIKTGKMLCGRDLGIPGFMANRDMIPPNRSLCLDCASMERVANK